MHKIYIQLIIILIVINVFTACRKSSTVESSKEIIAASFYPVYIMTLNVAKDIPGIKVIDMTKPQTGCLHDYQLIPDDLKTLESAQIFIINGAGMESFINKVIQQMPDLKIVEAGKNIELIKGTGNTGDNPHLWVSITNAILEVKNISSQLSVLDPKNALLYSQNSDVYIKKLEDLKTKMHSVLDNIKNRDIITFHEAFPYFAKEFNLNIAAVIEREPGSEPGAKELSDTINIIRKLKVKALFAEPQYPSKSADTIAKETGIKVYSLDPAVTGEDDPDSYIKAMENNLLVLKEALR